MKLNLGCCDRHMPGYVNVDVAPPADQIVDLRQSWPWPDGAVDEIVAHDIIEHLPQHIHTMNEAWRVLRAGGRFDIRVPTTEGRGAWQDPGHCCHDAATYVLTTDGWKLFAELTGSEQVFTLCQETWRAEPTAIEKIHTYNFSGTMVRFTGRGVDALVTPNHRMLCGSSDDKTPFSIREASELTVLSRPVRIPHGVKFDGDVPEYIELPGSRIVNATNPGRRFVGDSVRLQTRAFMEFMGWFLSEGSAMRLKDDSRVVVISQSQQANPEKFEQIGDCLLRLGVKPHRTKNGWRFNNKELGDWLIPLGHSHKKYVPRFLMDMHPELLEVLLGSALLGDGTKKGDDSWCYGTTSEQLSRDIAEIGLRLGYRVSISKDARIGKSLNINPDYRANHDMHLVYLSRCTNRYLTGATAESYKGTVHCVTAAKNHVICTMRNGKILWSGNSYWNRNSFFYYTHGDPHRERFGQHYGIAARFAVVHEEHVHHPDNVVHLHIVLEAVK